MMMHFLDEIDAPLERKLAVYCAAANPPTADGPCTTAATST